MSPDPLPASTKSSLSMSVEGLRRIYDRVREAGSMGWTAFLRGEKMNDRLEAALRRALVNLEESFIMFVL